MLNLRYKTGFPKNPNQSRHLTVLTIPDSALWSLCCKIILLSWHQNTLITKCLWWDRNGLY